MNTTDYKAAKLCPHKIPMFQICYECGRGPEAFQQPKSFKDRKLAEYDKAFSKLLEPADDGQYVGYYGNEHCCFIDQTKQVKAFISQTIDELNAQWRERIRETPIDVTKLDIDESLPGRKWFQAAIKAIKDQLIDALLSEGKEGGEGK